MGSRVGALRRNRSYPGTVERDGEEEVGMVGKGILSKRKVYTKHRRKEETVWSSWETARSLVRAERQARAIMQ